MAKRFRNRLPLHESTALAERTFTADERKHATKLGHAMEGGAFPIVTVADLKNAIQALGRAKDPEAARRHIVKRAKALHAVKLLPADWNVTEAADSPPLSDAELATLITFAESVDEAKSPGNIGTLIRTFGSWAGNSQATCANVLAGKGFANPDALCAWLKDRATGTTHWRGGKHKEAVEEADFSFDERRNLIADELNEKYPPSTIIRGDGEGSYTQPIVSLVDLYDDRVVYVLRDPDAYSDDDYFQCDYTIDAGGGVTLGDPTAVLPLRTYLPAPEEQAEEDAEAATMGEAVTESLASTTVRGELLEAVGTDGWRWRIQVIQAGVSQNQNEYPLQVLHEAVDVYNGIPVFFGRGRDHNPDERGVDAIAGYLTSPKPNAQGIEATFEINKGKPAVREAVLHAWDVRARTGRAPFGFSHVIPQGGATLEARKPRGYKVTKINRAESADLVITPAAGGGLLAPLAEANTVPLDPLLEAIMNVEDILRRIRLGESVTPEEWAYCRSTAASALAEAVAASPAPVTTNLTPIIESTTEAVDPRVTEAIAESDRRVAEALAAMEQATRLQECRSLLTQQLAQSHLPPAMQTIIATEFDGRVFEATELEGRITRDRTLAAELLRVRPTGLGAAPITDDQRTKHQQAMDVMLGIPHEGVRHGFRSLKEAYQAISGNYHESYIDITLSRRILSEAITYPGDDPLLRESIISSTFGEMLGDSITRRMLQEYGMPGLDTWRMIVSDTPAINDFRTQRRMRMGGYGDLPTVSQGAPYQPLSSPTDEEATYSLAKKGGLEDLTLETIANDDVGMVRRIPIKLGRAAARTLYHNVWVDTVVGNVTTTYDATTWFHASHGNTGTTALSRAEIAVIRGLMRSQSGYNNTSEALGAANTPRILAVPNELEETAWLINNSAVLPLASAFNATEPNMFRNTLQVVVIDDWTDATDWYMFADPQQVPILEVGFLNGREEPELFVQDAQTVGSVFTADKVTYKIRFIYGIGVLDHRGAYREVVAG